jgi:hypothetical protein
VSELKTIGDLIRDIGIPGAVIVVLFWDMIVERRRLTRNLGSTIDTMFKRFEASNEKNQDRFEQAMKQFTSTLREQEERYRRGREETAQRVLDHIDLRLGHLKDSPRDQRRGPPRPPRDSDH